MDERAAVSRLKQGDIGGLDVLVRLYQVPALHAAFLICQDYGLAEDIVQSSFVRAYESIATFDSSRPFGPWFLRSVVNSTLTSVAAASRRAHASWESQVDESDMLSSLEPGVQQALEAAETREEILAALEKLSPGQRAAVVMRYFLDLSDTQIAQQLDVPIGTVRRRLHDARKRLRRLIPA